VSFKNEEDGFKWFRRIQDEIAPVSVFGHHFAVAFFVTMKESPETQPWDITQHNAPVYQIQNEVKRLGFDLDDTWRISFMNEKHR